MAARRIGCGGHLSAREAILIVVVALSTGSCGVFNGELLAGGKPGKPSGDKARYISHVDPICREANDKVTSLGDLGDPAALERLRRSQTARREEVERIKAVRDLGNGVDQLKIEVFVARLSNLKDTLDAAVLALERGDPRAADTFVATAKAVQRETREAAKDFGLVECAKT